MTDIEYLNKSIREKIVERVKNGFFDGAGGYLKAMDYYAKGLITLDTVKSIEAEIEAWEEAKASAEVVAEETTTEEVVEETETEMTETETDLTENETEIEEIVTEEQEATE